MKPQCIVLDAELIELWCTKECRSPQGNNDCIMCPLRALHDGTELIHRHGKTVDTAFALIVDAKERCLERHKMPFSENTLP